jgi:NAD(P)-dependent dehydrogenase (short-subunit alcohol dehydrogenase family)
MADPLRIYPALVTGASRGLGFAIAAELGRRGRHVVAVARTVGGLEELDDTIKAAGTMGGGSATLAPMDVTNADAMDHLAKMVGGRWGGLSLWVHAAIHAAPLAPAGHIDAKDFAKSVACNVTATATLIPLVEPLLRAGTGTAVFLDDPRAGQKFFGAYGATKAAQIALARSWQAEGAKVGPRVVIATPAPMPTATRARFFPGEDRGPLADPAGEARAILDAL